MEVNTAVTETPTGIKRTRADVSRDYSQAAMELGDLVHRMKNEMPVHLAALEKKLNGLIHEMKTIEVAELASKEKPSELHAVS
jgi:hypothetical protein